MHSWVRLDQCELLLFHTFYLVELTGQVPGDSQLDNMLKEADGPLNFATFLTLFGDRLTGLYNIIIFLTHKYHLSLVQARIQKTQLSVRFKCSTEKRLDSFLKQSNQTETYSL